MTIAADHRDAQAMGFTPSVIGAAQIARR